MTSLILGTLWLCLLPKTENMLTGDSLSCVFMFARDDAEFRKETNLLAVLLSKHEMGIAFLPACMRCPTLRSRYCLAEDFLDRNICPKVAQRREGKNAIPSALLGDQTS